MTTVAYDFDIIAWAYEQAALLRSGNYSLLDIEHIAEEIEDVGKSEQRELSSRLVVLLAHLLKWQYEPERQGNSWRFTISVQRKDVAYALKETPSLKNKLNDPEWMDLIWFKAMALAASETGLPVSGFPDACPWNFEQVMDADFWPGD